MDSTNRQPDTVVADLYMVGKDYFAGKLAKGMRFEVVEGRMVAADGVIVDIVKRE